MTEKPCPSSLTTYLLAKKGNIKLKASAIQDLYSFRGRISGVQESPKIWQQMPLHMPDVNQRNASEQTVL